MENLQRRDTRALTGLRGIAALGVAIYHFTRPELMPLPYEPPVFLRGYLAVDLFFVLSGFILAYTYGAIFHSRITAQAVWNFMLKRFARIYPTYFAISLYGAISFWRHGHLSDLRAHDILANLLMAQGWGLDVVSLLGNAWSVSTEIVAYCLLPFFAFGLVRMRFLWAALLIGAIIAMLAVCAFGHGVHGALDVTDPNSILPLVRCLAGFTVGMLTFEARRLPVLLRLGTKAGTFCCIMALVTMAPTDLFVFFLFPLLVLALYSGNRAGNLLFANRFAMYFGTTSYSLYLVHPFVQNSARAVAQHVRLYVGYTAGNAVGVVVALTMASIMAAACFHIVEQPARRTLIALGRAANRRAA